MAADSLAFRPALSTRSRVITARRTTLLPPGWPLSAVLCLYPLWWAIGIGDMSFILASIPMIWQMARHRPIRLPSGFAIWVLFLVWVVGCSAMLGVNPPGTIPGVFSHRILTALLRLLHLLSATVVLVYMCNLPEGVSQRRVLRWIAIFCATTVAGGLLGMIAPHFEFTAPIEHLVPSHLRNNMFVRSQFHPTAAQVQQVLGVPSGRPAAPFTYTNTWGNVMSVLLIWLVVSARMNGHRLRTALLILIALAPITYSLNRGMWLGLIVIILYTGFRAAMHGHTRVLRGVFVGTILFLMVFLATPLHSMVVGRLHHGTSNDIRQYTSVQAFKYAERSPIVGYGATRSLQGGEASITIGRSSTCQRCGNPILGENGEIWSVIISDGFVGGAFYLGFFLFGIMKFWRDRTPVGIAGVGVLLLAVGYSFIYNANGTPLCLYMISYGLLWTNSRLRDNRPKSAAVVPATA